MFADHIDGEEKKMRQRKKIVAVLMSAVLVLSLAACGSGQAAGDVSTETQTQEAAGTETVGTDEVSEDAVFANPGTYTAAAAGRNGQVTVTAEFTATEIVSITVDSEETETIGVAAMDTMIAQILANQSLGVDTVTGATISGEALLEALASCVEQAGGDVEALQAATVAEDHNQAEYVTEADVIVVGAGGAGLTAALTASEEGASVILLEKSNTVGGNTLCATMGINAADSQVQAELGVEGASYDDLYQDLIHEDAQVEALVEAYVTNSGETIDWLAGLGVEFTAGQGTAYMLMAEADGKTCTTMVNAVYRAVQASDVTLYLNVDATALVQDENGAVTGVTATDSDGKEVTFSGRSIILCTGGFGQNQELLSQVRPDLATAITDEIAPTTGEGLLMAQKVGADTIGLEYIQLFPHVIVGYGLLTPMNLPGGFNTTAIYVNENGERFAAEGFEISEAILAQPDGMAYCIFNESDLNDTLQTLVDNGFIVTGTVAQVAEALGLNADTLQATIDAWNAGVDAGEDSLFGSRNLNRIDTENTVCGYNFGVGAHYFMGGILINENTQVVNTEGDAIQGLYAAGEVTGGFHGDTRVDGCGLGDAFIFGRLAGREAAAHVSEQ